MANSCNINNAGIVTTDAVGTFNGRTLVQPAAGITISDANGVSANPTFALANDLLALENLAGVGFAARTAADTWNTRTLTAPTDGSLTISNGNGVSGNPIYALSDRVRMQGVYFENIGIAYNAGTGVFTIQSASGSAFSASNPGIVVLPSKATPGQFTKYSITSNQSFIDDNGASEIIGNLFGLTTGVAYTEDLPFYIYAVTNDTETTIQFMLSRVPNRTTSPLVASIGAPDDPVADTQGSFWSLDNIDETLYDENPCACIGSFRMRMSASDDWTVQTLDNADGIGQFQEEREFNVALGTFGAATGTFLLDNGGTAPIFTTNTFIYHINRDGKYSAHYRLNADGGTDGAGAVNTLMINPFFHDTTYNNIYAGNTFITTPSSTTLGQIQLATNGQIAFVYQSTIVTAVTVLTNSAFTNGFRQLTGNHEFYISIL